MERTRSDFAEMLVTLMVGIGDGDEKEDKQYVATYLRGRQTSYA